MGSKKEELKLKKLEMNLFNILSKISIFSNHEDENDSKWKSFFFFQKLNSEVFFPFFLNWDSLHARLKEWSYKIKEHKKLKLTENVFKKNLQLLGVC